MASNENPWRVKSEKTFCQSTWYTVSIEAVTNIHNIAENACYKLQFIKLCKYPKVWGRSYIRQSWPRKTVFSYSIHDLYFFYFYHEIYNIFGFPYYLSRSINTWQ